MLRRMPRDMMVLRSFLCILLVLVHSSFTQWMYKEDRCSTPDGEQGTCIIVNNCDTVLNYLRENQPLTPVIISNIRKYQCGFEGTVIKVCCPKNPIGSSNSSDNSEITTNRNIPPDVSSHRNLNLLPQKCGTLNLDDRIIFGNETSLFEFPWMVLISYRTSRGPDFRCGGTLINNRYILTAAHCVDTNLPILGVRIGEHDIETPIDCESHVLSGGTVVCAPAPQDIGVEETIVHPSWNNPPYSNDIALIRLATPANTSVESVEPVCLPLSNEMRNFDFNGKKVIVTGWGATETGRSSSTLLKVDLDIFPFEQCKKNYQRQANITFRQTCAGGKNRKDSCQGDSGGPMQYLEMSRNSRYTQLGIVSFGPKLCGSEGFPGVYTKVTYYMDWILDSLKP